MVRGSTAITKRQARRRPDYVYPEYLYRPWVELAQLLAQITPGKLEKTYRATGGSEAVDIALQIAMASTGRREFVSIEGSYHGNTVGTLSVASSEEREPYPNLLSNCANDLAGPRRPCDKTAGDASQKARRRLHHG